MAGTNEFKTFAAAVGSNTLTPSAWAALVSLLNNGFVAGVADSTQANTLFRQVSTMAAALGKFIADANFNALDDGNTTNLATAFTNALKTVCLPLAGGTVTGALTVNASITTTGDLKLNNNQYLQGKTTGGTYQTLIGVDASNNMLLAQSSGIQQVLMAVLGTNKLWLANNGLGLFGAPTYPIDIASRTSTDAQIVARAPSGNAASLSLAGHGSSPFSSSFDVIKNASGSYLWSRGNGSMYLGTNDVLAIEINGSQQVNFNGGVGGGGVYSAAFGRPVILPQFAASVLGGITGTPNLADYFIYDTNKRISHYGLAWGNFSDNVGGAAAALSGYAGLRVFSQGVLRYKLTQGGYQMWGGVENPINNATYTFWDNNARPIAVWDGASGYSYSVYSYNGGNVLGYIGQSSALVGGGSVNGLAIRAESELTFSIGSTRYAVVNSAGFSVGMSGASTTSAISLLSQGANAYTAISIGRTSANEVNLGIAGNANEWFPGTAAGDGVLKANGNLFLGSPFAKNVYLISSGVAKLQIDGAGGIYVRPDVDGLNTNLDNYRSRSFSSNGYQKLPTGLILQWGFTAADGAVTFPVAFPTACRAVCFGSNSASGGVPRAAVGTISATGFTYQSANVANTSAFWFAIGH